MSTERTARPRQGRLIQVLDTDPDGRRHVVLATADPLVVRAVERAVRERVRRYLGGEPSVGEPED